MSNPAISVIVPMYNVERYIKVCIDSILAQTFQDFEIIIVDDASPDNSYNICRNLYGNNEKVRIVRHEKNQGLGPARNTGIENALGKYVYFVDSDDAILPNALETLYRVSEHTGADVVHTSGYFETEQDDDTPLSVRDIKLFWDNYKKEGFITKDILYRWEKFWTRALPTPEHISPMAWLHFCKKDVLEKFSIHFEPIISEDDLFSFELFAFIEKYFVLNQAFYVYRKRAGSIMRSFHHDKLNKAILSDCIASEKMKFVMNRFQALKDNASLQDHFIFKLFENFGKHHIIPFYANGLNEESLTVINNILGGMFGENTTFVKYFFHKANSFQVQFEKLNAQTGQLYGAYQQLSQENIKLKNNHKSRACETFVRNIDSDEIRNGFLVTSHRKKLWNVQIGLINEFARICKKYNLKWFAYGGTLLGAVRHKGFIPWDDDVDIAMLRPDYNKFLKVAPEEIKYPYFFDPWYNYRLENDTNSSLKEELNLPLIKESTLAMGRFPNFPIIKIRDSRTTQIEFPNRTNVNQGIWIDIFPFNSVPPFTEKKHQIDFETARELLMAILNPEAIRKSIQDRQQLLISYEELEKFLQLSYKQRCIQFDNFSEKIFFESEKVGALEDYIFSVKTKRVFNLKNYDQTVYFPFEEIEIPAPSGWEDCLTAQYGDWRKMVYTHTHAKDWSTDIPYNEYYRTSAFVNK